MKIVILDGYAANPGDLSYDGYLPLGEVALYPRTAPGDIISRIGDAEIVLTNKCVMTREIIEACPNLRYIGVQATGYNIIDLAAAREHGVVVTNIPAYSTASVVQHTFALMFGLMSQIVNLDNAVHQDRWVNSKDFCFWDQPLVEAEGKTLGIIGYGQIGRRVAAAAQAFGMKVVAYGPHKRDNCMTDTLEELLRQSDVVSLHCPQKADNAGMINKETLAMMKPGALLINTARGGLLNEADVAAALRSGQLGGAAMDVLSAEPMAADNPLRNAPNCIITPHIAWASLEARKRLMEISLNNVKAWLEDAPVNVVS